MPRLNVHTNQILVHTFSYDTLDFVASVIHTLVYVVLLISLAIPTNITFWISHSFTFLVVTLATTVSSLVDEGPIKKSEPVFI